MVPKALKTTLIVTLNLSITVAKPILNIVTVNITKFVTVPVTITVPIPIPLLQL